jgi:hypothetical protein
MPKNEQARLTAELRDLETERLRLARELQSRGDHGVVGIYMSAEILRHRIALALLRSRLNFEES